MDVVKTGVYLVYISK